MYGELLSKVVNRGVTFVRSLQNRVESFVRGHFCLYAVFRVLLYTRNTVIYLNKDQLTPFEIFVPVVCKSYLAVRFRISALPPELYSYWEAYPWRLGPVFCILKSYIQELTAYASVLTIAAFTIERYLAICHPMTLQVLNSPARAVKLILLQWFLAFLCALPFAIYTRSFYLVHRPDNGEPIPESLVCNVPNHHRDTMTYFFQISTFVFFVYPMSVILIMYILIGIKLSNANPVPNDRNHSAVVQARKSVIKMLGNCHKEKYIRNLYPIRNFCFI